MPSADVAAGSSSSGNGVDPRAFERHALGHRSVRTPEADFVAVHPDEPPVGRAPDRLVAGDEREVPLRVRDATCGREQVGGVDRRRDALEQLALGLVAVDDLRERSGLADERGSHR